MVPNEVVAYAVQPRQRALPGVVKTVSTFEGDPKHVAEQILRNVEANPSLQEVQEPLSVAVEDGRERNRLRSRSDDQLSVGLGHMRILPGWSPRFMAGQG